MRVDCWFAVLAHDIVSHIQMQIRILKNKSFEWTKNFYRWSKANAKAHKWNIVKSMTPNISMTWIGNIKHSYTDIDMLLHAHTHKITKKYCVSFHVTLVFLCSNVLICRLDAATEHTWQVFVSSIRKQKTLAIKY